ADRTRADARVHGEAFTAREGCAWDSVAVARTAEQDGRHRRKRIGAADGAVGASGDRHAGARELPDWVQPFVLIPRNESAVALAALEHKGRLRHHRHSELGDPPGPFRRADADV